jgi:guanosine-3',5'-bis(diphosphate) 3'-pyrophosphohydrolase
MCDPQSPHLLKAIHFAAQKHRHQRRKDVEQSPYINHPIQVAYQLVDLAGVEDSEVLMAAILHDTLEDTATTAQELEAQFGATVRQLVESVTDDKRLPKPERKQRQIDHAATLSPGAALIKISDKIANVRDVAQSPPAGWDMARKQQYLDWAEAVVNNCPTSNLVLKQQFQQTVAAARAQMLNEG